jgi:hypothetical protein
MRNRKLLDFNGGSGCFQGCFDFFSVGTFDVFLDGSSCIGEGLCFGKAEAGNFSDNLDYGDF